MKRGRTPHPFSYFLLITFLCLIPFFFSQPIPLHADDFITDNKPATPAEMTFKPAAAAESFAELMAVDTLLNPISATISFPAQLPEQVSITQTIPVTATTLTTLNPERDNAISINNDQIGVVIESGTFTQTAALEFTLLAVAPADPVDPITPTLPVDFPYGQGVYLYETAQTFLSFQVEAIDAVTAEPITTFNKQVRLAIDIRDQGYNFPEHGVFFVAYRSDEDPNEWIDVPITVYEPGFYSADVDHFSTWATGWRPDGWALAWSPPSADGFSGASMYSYPFQLPPGRGGLQPSLALSYSNSAINGATRQVSAGSVAAGWSLNQIAIVRTGVKLASPSALEFPEKFRLVLNGTGYKLTATSETINGGTRYTADNGPQLLILKYSDYWIAINGDGTHYRIGYTAESRTWHHLILNAHLANDYNPESNPTYSQGIIEWHVDTVTDTSGNQITYHYDNSVNSYYDNFITDCFFPPHPPGFCAIQLFTKASRLTNIYYNFSTRITTLPPAHNVARLNSTDAATRINLLYNQNGGRFSNLLVYHKSSNPIREYALNSAAYSYQNPGCPIRPGVPRTTSTYTVQNITEYGWNSATGIRYALPTTQFGYVGRRNYTASGDNACFIYHHLKWATNGYGGRVEFDYGHDNRNIGEYTYSGSGPLTYPEVGFSHYVIAMRQMDGRGNTSRVTYARHGACYNQTQWVGAACPSSDDAPNYGVLGGFYQVETFYWKLDGTTLERVEETIYNTNQERYGQPWRQDVKDSSYAVRQRTDTEYHLNLGDFHPVASVTNTWYVAGLASTSLSTKVTYEYNPSYQGSGTIQYGNLTHIREYGDANASTPYRITRRWYKPNTNIISNNSQWHWLVSFLEKEAVYSSENGTALTIRYIHYDGLGLGVMPNKGLVTRVRQGDPNTPCGGETGCSYARKTIETGYTYDSFGNLLTTTTYTGYGYQSFYADNTPHTTTLASGGRTTTLAYDPDYKLYPVQVSDPGGYITKFDVYGFKNSSGTLVNLDGFSRQTGLLKQVIGANGLLTLYEYDPFGRLTNVYDAAGDRGTPNNPWDGNPVTRYQYFDNAWQGNQQLDPDNNKPFPIVVHNRPQTYHTGVGGTGYELKQVTYYDGLGRPIQSQERWVQVNGVTNRQDRIVTTAYDARGRTTCTTIPYTVDTYTIRTGGVGSGFLTHSCASHTHTTTAYDDMGRVEEVRDANNNPTARYAYGITHHVTVDSFTKLQRTTITDANNHITSQFNNSRGQLVLVREFTGTGSTANPVDPYVHLADTRYRYDLFGNLLRVGTSDWTHSQPADNSSAWLRATTMSYDAFGRKTGMTDPDMGTWAYSYDAASNLIRQQDAKGQVLCFFYDNLNRITSKRRDNPVNGCSGSDTLLASYSYFGPSNGSSSGQVSEIQWPNSNNRDTFSYNSKGLLATHTRRIDGYSYTLIYGAYDLLNRPTSLTYPNDEVVTMTYDREGENSLAITSSPYNPTGSLVDLVSYNQQGQLVKLERGNGVDSLYSYYQFPLSSDYKYDSGRLLSIQHGGTHDPLPDFKYFYDNVGNIDKIETFATPIGNNNLYLDTQTFSYDEQNRLITANGTGHSALNIVAYQEIYDHDLLGNLIQLGHQGQTTLAYNDGAHKHAATHRNGSSTPAYVYDANGNMTSRVEGSTTYTQLYDAENRLVSVTAGGYSTTFAYDASGQRVKTTAHSSSSQRTVTHYPFPNYEVEQQQT